MNCDTLANYTNILRGYRDDPMCAEFYVICSLQNEARLHPDHPEWDVTDEQLGAWARMLLAALKASKTPVDV